MKSYSLWGECDKYGNPIRNNNYYSKIPKGWSPQAEKRIIPPEPVETDEEKLEKMMNDLDEYELIIVNKLKDSGENAANIIKCLEEIL